LLILIFFAAVLWGLNYFYHSDYFKVKNIDVQDNEHYKDEEVTALIPEVIGVNLFDINKKIIEDTIADELDWVRDAELSKIFPNRVVIKLIERRPDLIILYKDEYFLMDGDGVILDKIEMENLNSYGDLILVKNAVSHRINIGEKVAKKNVLSCADIYKAMESKMRSIMREARIEGNVSGDIIFETYDGMEIIFGNGSEVIKKIEILKQLLKEEMDYTIIDLRSWENPVVNQ
jgi:cell division protein FtsQ